MVILLNYYYYNSNSIHEIKGGRFFILLKLILIYLQLIKFILRLSSILLLAINFIQFFRCGNFLILLLLQINSLHFFNPIKDSILLKEQSTIKDYLNLEY